MNVQGRTKSSTCEIGFMTYLIDIIDVYGGIGLLGLGFPLVY